MSLLFVIESSPVPQAESERVFTGGQLSIGRSAEADWQVEDPKMFVSRRHCVISEEDGRVMVTDASSGGLYIDNAANPVGLGNAVPVEPGMRLHMGDFTLRVEAASGAPQTDAPKAPAQRSSFFPDDDTPSGPPAPPRERPANLPDPFGLRSDGSQENRQREVKRPPRPLEQADPFGLDLRKDDGSGRTAPSQEDDRPRRGFFEDDGDVPADPPLAPEKKPDIFGDWKRDPEKPEEPAPAPERDTPDGSGFSFDIGPPDTGETDPPEPPRTAPAPERAPAAEPGPAPPRARPAAVESDLRDALLRGMGLDPAQVPSDDPVAEMEHLGRSMHRLVEGVMLLLRTRAQEKQKVRVAQTIIASADVNPLKFLATPEDALSALIRPRGKGYMAPDAAVEGAFRDLADHQVRTWSALQVALRRMVDKFDPSEIEKEMEDVGLLESLVAGGRSAKLWQIYEDRYREIAETAEKQFLGDVGVDFRDAYENRRTD